MADRAPRPRDRFDDVPEDLARVGAHRAPVRRRGIVTLAWAALATGALVGVGVLGLGLIEGRVSGAGGTASGGTATAQTSSAAAGPAATVDPDAEVVVLNATTTGGLAAKASTAAADGGWSVASTANADVQDLKASTVYYGTAAQLGAAKGLARTLGIAKAPVQSDRFDVEGRARLTVVLGADWAAAQ